MSKTYRFVNYFINHVLFNLSSSFGWFTSFDFDAFDHIIGLQGREGHVNEPEREKEDG